MARSGAAAGGRGRGRGGGGREVTGSPLYMVY